jgi:hypothetical protein
MEGCRSDKVFLNLQEQNSLLHILSVIDSCMAWVANCKFRKSEHQSFFILLLNFGCQHGQRNGFHSRTQLRGAETGRAGCIIFNIVVELFGFAGYHDKLHLADNIDPDAPIIVPWSGQLTANKRTARTWLRLLCWRLSWQAILIWPILKVGQSCYGLLNGYRVDVRVL